MDGQHTIVTYEPGTDNRQQVIYRDVTTAFAYEPDTGRLRSRTVTVDNRPFAVGYDTTPTTT